MFLAKNKFKKRALCSLFVFLIALIQIQAQNFTECFNYEIGSIHSYKKIHHLLTSDFIDYELNKKGANVFWNLHDTEIVYYSGEYLLEIWQANLVNGYNNFPGTNTVKKFPNEFDQFLIQDSSGIYLVGQLSFPIIKYTNYKKLINYPHGLFECSIDSFSIDSIQNMVGGWNTSIQGTSQNCFDAQGQIYFQSGTSAQVYRYTRIDTTNYLSDGQPARQVEMETYWYDSDCNMHSPIIFAKGYQDINGLQHYNSIYILKEYALGNDEIAEKHLHGFSASLEHESLVLKNNLNICQRIELFNVEGKMLHYENLQPKEEKVIKITSHFATGLYFINSNLVDGKKLAITH